jgi:hypothetical protein
VRLVDKMAWRGPVIALGALITLMLLPVGQWGEHSTRRLSKENREVRIAIRASEPMERDKLQRLVDVVQVELRRLPGLPVDVLAGKDITIAVASDGDPYVEGSSSLLARLILLPPEALYWRADRQVRLVRHELAHVALATFTDWAILPFWLTEGFAEWAAGGLDCRAEARIGLSLKRTQRMTLPPPRLDELAPMPSQRIAYDYAASFFEFLELEWDGVVSSGRFTAGIRANGVQHGIRRLFRMEPEALEALWLEHIFRRYARAEPGSPCSAAPPPPF